jgi:precorrin-3B synthase
MRRGWCPTVFEPMPSGDGLLVRVKPPGSRLTSAQARLLAAAAAQHGNGALELTRRGNLQVRGLTAASAPDFAAAMVAAGLASPDAAEERRRNVLLAPLARAATAAVARALETRLVAAEALAGLPPKFGFAVDDDGPLPLTGADAAIRLHADRQGWLVWQAGAARATRCAEPVAATLHLAQALLSGTAAHWRGSEDLPVASPPAPIGPLDGGFGAAPPFGALDAALLAAMARLAEQFGDGTLQLSPWRAIVVPGADIRMAEAAATRGLIVDPADPRLGVIACPGSPACASGLAPTRADAARFAAALPGIALHLSGCAKGCAHPGPAPLTLVATADGYALVRDGRAGDPPRQSGLSLVQAIGVLAA